MKRYLLLLLIILQFSCLTNLISNKQNKERKLMLETVDNDIDKDADFFS